MNRFNPGSSGLQIFSGGRTMDDNQMKIWEEYTSKAFKNSEKTKDSLYSREYIMKEGFISLVGLNFSKIKKLSKDNRLSFIHKIASYSYTITNYYEINESKFHIEIAYALLNSCYLIKQCCVNFDINKDKKLIKEIENHIALLEELTITEIKNSNTKSDSNEILNTQENEQRISVSKEELANLIDTITIIIDIVIEIIANYICIKKALSNDEYNINKIPKRIKEQVNISEPLLKTQLAPIIKKAIKFAEIAKILEPDKEINIVQSCSKDLPIHRGLIQNNLIHTLIHMIYNSISHGVESKQDRISVGKNSQATIEVKAYKKDNKTFIEIKDDGRGIDSELLYNTALKNGLIDPLKNYTDDEKKELIFLSGLTSSKTRLDGYSGKGKFMTVQKIRIAKIGGDLHIQSEMGKGTTFILEFPEDYTLMEGLVALANSQYFVIAVSDIKEILTLNKEQLISTDEEITLLKYENKNIKIATMSNFFKYLKKDKEPFLKIIIIKQNKNLLGIPITDIISEKEIIIQGEVNKNFDYAKYISGTTITEKCKPALVLNTDALFNELGF